LTNGQGRVLGEIKSLILIIILLKLLDLWHLLLCRRAVSGGASFPGWDGAAACWEGWERAAFDGAGVEAESHGCLIGILPEWGGRAGWHVLTRSLGRAWWGELGMNAMGSGCDEGVAVVLEI
jgi:hypothetical protein